MCVLKASIQIQYSLQQSNKINFPQLQLCICTDAVPSQFPNCPHYMTPKRLVPETKRMKLEHMIEQAIAGSIETKQVFNEKIGFSSR